MTELEESDDYLHEPGKAKDWRESYYFNWVDTDNDVSGFSTIGLLPNAKKREFVFALFYHDQREIHFVEPDGEFAATADEALSDGVLSYKLQSPLDKWTLEYQKNDFNIHIDWQGRFPCYDFGSGSGTSWEGHFEQSGRVKGEVQLPDGNTLQIDGLGERDKSWGSRDWHIQAWYAFHAQFDDFSIGLRRDRVSNEFYASGGISNKEGHVPIERVDLETETKAVPNKMPYAATTTIHGADDSTYSFKSRTISNTSFVRFERKFTKGQTELFENMAIHQHLESGEQGTGLLEWLFTHPA